MTVQVFYKIKTLHVNDENLCIAKYLMLKVKKVIRNTCVHVVIREKKGKDRRQ